MLYGVCTAGRSPFPAHQEELIKIGAKVIVRVTRFREKTAHRFRLSGDARSTASLWAKGGYLAKGRFFRASWKGLTSFRGPLIRIPYRFVFR